MSGRWQSWTTTTATSILAIRTHLFPAWLGWIGLMLALVVIGFAFVPVFGLVAWVLLIGLLLLRPAISPRPVEPAV
jgi:hypothetical protein